VRISLDLLRTRERESALVETCLRIQQRFIVNSTNATAAERARYILPSRAAGFFASSGISSNPAASPGQASSASTPWTPQRAQ
jgi:hypothetical protein